MLCTVYLVVINVDNGRAFSSLPQQLENKRLVAEYKLYSVLKMQLLLFFVIIITLQMVCSSCYTRIGCNSIIGFCIYNEGNTIFCQNIIIGKSGDATFRFNISQNHWGLHLTEIDTILQIKNKKCMCKRSVLVIILFHFSLVLTQFARYNLYLNRMEQTTLTPFRGISQYYYRNVPHLYHILLFNILRVFAGS